MIGPLGLMEFCVCGNIPMSEGRGGEWNEGAYIQRYDMFLSGW